MASINFMYTWHTCDWTSLDPALAGGSPFLCHTCDSTCACKAWCQCMLKGTWLEILIFYAWVCTLLKLAWYAYASCLWSHIFPHSYLTMLTQLGHHDTWTILTNRHGLQHLDACDTWGCIFLLASSNFGHFLITALSS